jgi:hypothetical protein
VSEHFIGEEIEVQNGACYPGLESFRWRGDTYQVRKVVGAWQDYGFAGWMKRPRWWQRRHKNFYRIETREGRTFELYCDRGSKRMTWVLVKEL